MSAKFFLLYGNKTITAHVTDAAELAKWVQRDGFGFNPGSYKSDAEMVVEADKILKGRYEVWALFDYTPADMAEFLETAAEQTDELVGLAAIELAEEFVQDAQKQIALALTEAQQKAMERVQFPIAGDKAAFGTYQAKIAEIRDLSIKGLYEYVENGDESPE